jgi:hypothetical protein
MRIQQQSLVPQQKVSIGLLFLKLFFGKIVIPAIGTLTFNIRTSGSAP